MSSPSARPTLEQVAARAGCSRATVSRVVNGSPVVRPAVRDAVLRAIRELGYVPNQAARTLARGRTDAVALIVSEPQQLVFSDPFFGSLVRGVSAGLGSAGLQLVLLMAGEDSARVAGYVAGHHVDGVLLVSTHRGDPLLAMVTELGIPAVYGGYPWDQAERLLWVDVDNVAGARTAARRLLDRGRRRVATITGPLDQRAAVDRLEGFRAELGELFDPDLVAEGDFTHVGGDRAMTALLERAPDVDAVFAASDAMAASALRVLRRFGRKVPDDVAIVGFDDVADLAPWTDPPLTTVHQSPEEMGRRMVALLVRLIAGEPGVQPERLPTSLVVRDSA